VERPRGSLVELVRPQKRAADRGASGVGVFPREVLGVEQLSAVRALVRLCCDDRAWSVRASLASLHVSREKKGVFIC
jgi:hypothetical protein